MSLYNVFNTIEAYEKAKAYDDAKFLAYHRGLGNNDNWLNDTVEWATGLNRATDNKIVYPVCPFSDGVYTTEELNTGGEWFPEIEESV